MCFLLKNLGALRLGLTTLVVVSLFAVPPPHTPAELFWPEIIPTLIAPAVAPLLFMVVALDLMMSRVMAAGEDEETRRRMRFISWWNLALIAALLALWAPFFAESLARPGG